MTRSSTKPVIGILGGVGSGKSTVAGLFADLGCGVIDADKLGHQVLDEPAVREQLRQWWGDAMFGPGGQVDRAAVAARVFGRPDELARLNALAHPRIRRAITRGVEAMSDDPAISAVVVDAALLLETDWHELCTHFVFVAAPDSERMRRVSQTRGWSADDWHRRENSQKALDIKAAAAHYVVDNGSSVSCLREQVFAVFHQIVHPAK